ncbi:adenine phosphoribosyltransferase [soil metagenome]
MAKLRPMDQTSLDKLNAGIRDVSDFPEPGIVFKDITPVLGHPELWSIATRALIETAGAHKIDKVVGIDARGFIFGAVVADRLEAGFVPIRKKGKLPWTTEGCSYSLEYGFAEVEIHKDAFQPGETVLLVDDLLATGGTAAAAVRLIKSLGGNLVGASFLIELAFLDGRSKLESEVPVFSILTY